MKNIYIIMSLAMLISTKLHSQSSAKDLKVITIKLTEILDRNAIYEYEVSALSLIKEGRELYQASNEKSKLDKQFEKFVLVENAVKSAVQKYYLPLYENGKNTLLTANIGSSELSENYLDCKKAVKKLIAFSIDPKLSDDLYNLSEYKNFMDAFGKVQTEYNKSKISPSIVLKYDSINSLFKQSAYYKEVDFGLKSEICEYNKKKLETFESKISIIREAPNTKKHEHELKIEYKRAMDISSSFIGNSCLETYFYEDSLNKYQNKIENLIEDPKLEFNSQMAYYDKISIYATRIINLTKDIDEMVKKEMPASLSLFNEWYELRDQYYVGLVNDNLPDILVKPMEDTDEVMAFFNEGYSIVNPNRVVGILLLTALIRRDCNEFIKK